MQPGTVLFGRQDRGSHYVNMAVLLQSRQTVYWFTCHGKLFDSLQLVSEECRQLMLRKIDPFIIYQIFNKRIQLLATIEHARMRAYVNSDEAEDGYQQNTVYVIPSDSARRKALQVLIGMERSLTLAKTQLLLFNSPSPQGLHNNDGMAQVPIYLRGSMIRTADSTMYYNTITAISASKITLRRDAPGKLYVYNADGVVLDSMPLYPEKYTQLLNEKGDVFLLYRDWLERQWQLLEEGKTAWLQSYPFGYSYFRIGSDHSMAKSLFGLERQQAMIDKKISTLIDPQQGLIEQEVGQIYGKESTELSYVPGLGIGYNIVLMRGDKQYELGNHLGNVLVTVSDKKLGVSSSDGIVIDHYKADVVSATDYYPFGSLMPGRQYTANNTTYRYGFNGKEQDPEVKGAGDQYDYGFRMYDPRVGRWLSVDAEAKRYPGYSPYGYALNTPLAAVDPDGKLIIFIGGLRLWIGQGDQKGYGYNTSDAHQGIYSYDIYKYWSTEKNSFGRKADIAAGFINRLNDKNAWYTSGSSSWTSQPEERIDQGKEKAKLFNAMVQSGQIKLAKDETIKIVSHSQGGAFAEGFAEQLLSYKDAKGNSLYKIEVVYNITPHQPDKFSFNLPGVRGVQYSHPNDAVSSDAPWWLPNGGSKFSKIVGIREFDGRYLFGKPGQPEAEGPNGNRSGHNVTDNDFIFDIKPGEPGYVAPRNDTPQSTDKKPGG